MVSVKMKKSLTPEHGYQAQSSPAPFEVVTDRGKFCYNSLINVTVRATGGRKIMGVLIQPRAEYAGSGLEGGYWSRHIDTLKSLFCTAGALPSYALTHNQKLSAESVYGTYQFPPFISERRIVFHATVVTDRATFWVNLKSATVQFLSGDANDCRQLSTNPPKAAATPGPVVTAPARALTEDEASDRALLARILQKVTDIERMMKTGEKETTMKPQAGLSTRRQPFVALFLVAIVSTL